MPTVSDVASAAGVSTASVSRALNGEKGVSDKAREHIVEIAAQIGYRPNRLARGLRRQTATVWGLIISDIRNPFFTSLVRAVEDVAAEASHSVILCNSDEDVGKERAYLEMLLDERVAGVILTPASETASRLEPAIAAGVPVVAADRRLVSASIDTVTTDNKRAAHATVTHMIDQGARRVAILVGDTATTTARERLEGYTSALEDAGFQLDPSLILVGELQGTDARAITEGVLDRRDPPDALFMTNPTLAVGAIEAVFARKLRVPDDILLALYDDVPLASLVGPGLTTVVQPTYEIGHEAGELLLRRIRGLDGPPRHVVLESELVIRGSTQRR